MPSPPTHALQKTHRVLKGDPATLHYTAKHVGISRNGTDYFFPVLPVDLYKCMNARRSLNHPIGRKNGMHRREQGLHHELQQPGEEPEGVISKTLWGRRRVESRGSKARRVVSGARCILQRLPKSIAGRTRPKAWVPTCDHVRRVVRATVLYSTAYVPIIVGCRYE